MIPPLAGHYILRFLVQFALLLASARLCGELMKRYEQPPVFGELLAGLLLGPSLLGWVAPGLFSLLFPPDPQQYGEFLDEVLKDPPTHVAVIKARTEKPVYGHILVPTAADTHAQLAVEFAAMYAEDVGARVTLLHILPPPQQPNRRFLRKRYTPLDGETLKMMADTLLWELRPARAKSALQLNAKVIESDNVAEAIVREVHNGDYDLLVLSTDTRTGRSALFLDQQAEQLMNQVPCTAIVVMPKSLRLDTLH